MLHTKAPTHLEIILVMTAFAAGAIDIISFVKLGGVFASAMTGNLALLAFYAGKGALPAAIGSLLALIGFILGATLGTMQTRTKDDGTSLTLLLTMEVVLLAAFSALWFLGSHAKGDVTTDILIVLLSVAMGVQGIIGKKVNLSSIPTVVFTSTLTNMVIALTDSVASGKFVVPPDTRRQTSSISFYFIGALVASVMIYLGLQVLYVLPLVAIAIAWAGQTRSRRESAPRYQSGR